MQILKNFFFMTLLLISASYAQEQETEYRYSGKHYTISYKLENDLQIVRLHGEILSTHVEDLKGFYHVIDLLRENVPIKFTLQSGGGFLRNFIKLPKAMKKKCNSEESNCRITTVVPYYAYCASACINVFMFGDERIAGKSTRFGFHQAAVLPGMLKIKGYVQKTLIEVGVDETWIKDHNDLFSTLDITFLYPRQLEGSNIVTGLNDDWEY